MFDNENHVVDIPNGEFSSLSRLGFAFDRIHLKDKISWFSFPRLQRDFNNTVPAIPVLEKIRPLPSNIHVENLPLQVDPPPPLTLTYWNSDWYGNLTEIQSTFGYKHSTDNQFLSYQPLMGSILDPNTSITVYPGHENWVGYSHILPQDPLDALAPVLDKLTLIKHHDWACVKVTCPMMGPGQPEPTCWLCLNTTPLKYADMLILECSNVATFQWGEAFTAEKRELQDAEHFVYSETADYTPIFIELDTMEHPVEMGAFIGEVCIGAAVVESGDSAIMIRGYMPLDTSGVITFQQYYGSEKALPAIVEEYYVKNQETGIREKRTINSRERKKFYQVSFKKECSSLFNMNPLKLSYYPNPGPGSGILEYFLPEESEVIFEIFDVYGRKLNTHIISKKAAGNYTASWLELTQDDAAQGIFLIKMTACGNSVTTKIIMTQ
ncbi:MAG: T9SS type A sorting domain-containing protein [Bacteroidales bacterium]|nr:T9SS type A sorting domain-containing protein [Bacteroidales bacterium]